MQVDARALVLCMVSLFTYLKRMIQVIELILVACVPSVCFRGDDTHKGNFSFFFSAFFSWADFFFERFSSTRHNRMFFNLMYRPYCMTGSLGCVISAFSDGGHFWISPRYYFVIKISLDPRQWERSLRATYACYFAIWEKAFAHSRRVCIRTRFRRSSRAPQGFFPDHIQTVPFFVFPDNLPIHQWNLEGDSK